MSLLDTPLWEVIKASFSPTIWKELVTPIVDTLYITGVASLIVLVFGILLGILLTATSPDGVFPLRIPYTSTGWLINVMRSLPQSVMIILMIPVARLLFGHSYGRDPCIIAIAASCIPMFARIVESSLEEIAKGKIDAAKSVGCTNRQIVFRVIVPETLPSIIRGFTVAVISIISMTALAGLFGAGGIGDVAVRFGYQRFQHDRLFACVYILVILVQVIQGIGNGISNHMLRKRCLV